MLRYVRLFALFVKSSLQVELEYRSNFITQLVLSLFWSLLTFASVALFYSHTRTLGGWSFAQALTLVGLFLMLEGILSGLFEPNLRRVVTMVRDGTMDFVLMKPVNSQFISTLRHVKITSIADIAAGIGVMIFAINQLGYVPSLLALAQFALTLVASVAIIYSIWLAMCACAFWFVKIDHMQELFRAIWDTARFPVTAFPAVLRVALTFVMPIAFMTTVPAEALLGLASTASVVSAIGISGVMFVLSAQFWKLTIRNYSSASS